MNLNTILLGIAAFGSIWYVIKYHEDLKGENTLFFKISLFILYILSLVWSYYTIKTFL